MGFYDNAFTMIKQAYTELDRKTGPFRSWTDAFKKHSHVMIEELHQGQRKHWQVEFPGPGLASPGRRFSSGCSAMPDGCSSSCSSELPDVRSAGTRTPLPSCGVHGSCYAARNSSGA